MIKCLVVHLVFRGTEINKFMNKLNHHLDAKKNLVNIFNKT
jgi:hypothetical protein